ncbi:hypothetical protein AMJ39_07590 [candidate division TA06 bacterium DG_24]|jgi:hypothetical protein|uniref:FeoB-associated Cys-rich membrane protein n=1 Tax=candidate division TA06 bacterium DG_24 TaxID=1703770 RepID=A0A0S7WQY9_UNCT6|nr:MAG: hypothetical protein AMJ39_07590 [candidate division TA06 bacterium DG_24]
MWEKVIVTAIGLGAGILLARHLARLTRNPSEPRCDNCTSGGCDEDTSCSMAHGNTARQNSTPSER